MMYEARWEEKEREMRMNTRCSFRRTVLTLSWRPVVVTITLSMHRPLVFTKQAWRASRKINRGGPRGLYSLLVLGP